MRCISRTKCLKDYITYGAQIALRDLIKITGGDPFNGIEIKPPDGTPGSKFVGRIGNMKSYAGNGPLPPRCQSGANQGTEERGNTENDVYYFLLRDVLFPNREDVQANVKSPDSKEYLSVVGKGRERKTFLIIEDDGPLSPAINRTKPLPGSAPA